MRNAVAILGLLAVAAVISLGAAAQGSNREAYAVRKTACEEQADGQQFGIHEYQRHRFVICCIAGLSH